VVVRRKKWPRGKDLFFTWNERGNIEIPEVETRRIDPNLLFIEAI
jgi:hypothetical protein